MSGKLNYKKQIHESPLLADSKYIFSLYKNERHEKSKKLPRVNFLNQYISAETAISKLTLKHKFPSFKVRYGPNKR